MKKPMMKLSQLENSKVAGINKEVIAALKKPEKKKQKSPLPGERCHQAQWMWGQLVAWSLYTGIQVVDEYRFHPVRKWRFDFAIPTLMIAIEFEGVFSTKSRHTNSIGYTNDTDKYREAAKSGWTLLRYTSINYKTIIKDTNDIYSRLASSKKL